MDTTAFEVAEADEATFSELYHKLPDGVKEIVSNLLSEKVLTYTDN